MFQSTKTWGHEIGLSCCFRQWGAESHCRLLHGYAISVKLKFAATHLDHNNWVMDFGGLKPIKALLEKTFDHKLVVARNDPKANLLASLAQEGVAEIVWLESTGCEAFARHIGLLTQQWLNDHQTNAEYRRVWVHSCEIREHGANSAIWIQDRL